LDRLTSLVAKSLLRRQDSVAGESRFGMLETIREFGLEKLQASGEAEAVRIRHAQFLVDLAETAEPKLLGSEQLVWIQRLIAESGNIRAVLARSRDRSIPGELGLRLVGALSFFWSFTGVAWEARNWAESMLQLEAAAGRTRARARALVTASRMANLENDYTGARGFAEEAIAIFREVGDAYELVRALIMQMDPLLGQADYVAAEVNVRESLALAQRMGDTWGTAWAWSALGALHQHKGEYAEARRSRQRAAAMARSVGDRVVLGLAVVAQADLARQAGDVDLCEQLFREALVVSSELGPFWRVTPRAIAGLAGVACARGNFLRAARLLGAAERRWEAGGKQETDYWRRTVQVDQAAVRDALGSRSFAAARAEGRACPMEQAIDYALSPSGSE
jgi:non-specific serine/threonine protein kinase